MYVTDLRFAYTCLSKSSLEQTLFPVCPKIANTPCTNVQMYIVQCLKIANAPRTNNYFLLKSLFYLCVGCLRSPFSLSLLSQPFTFTFSLSHLSLSTIGLPPLFSQYLSHSKNRSLFKFEQISATAAPHWSAFRPALDPSIGVRSVPPVLPWAPELPPQFPPMSRNCHSPVSASHFSIQKSEIIQEQSNGYLVVFKCVKCRSLRLSGCKEPPGAGCAAPGERHFYLPGSPPPPPPPPPLLHHLTPQRPLSNAQICGVRLPSWQPTLHPSVSDQTKCKAQKWDLEGLEQFRGSKAIQAGLVRWPVVMSSRGWMSQSPLHQNCRRCHLPLLRNCAEIELGSFFLRGALLSSQFLRSRRNLMSCMAGIVFMRLRSVFLDEQTSFCRHLKGERLIEWNFSIDHHLETNCLELGWMQFWEWWQNLCWQLKSFLRDPIFLKSSNAA